jgi:hypothetical protein
LAEQAEREAEENRKLAEQSPDKAAGDKAGK